MTNELVVVVLDCDNGERRYLGKQISGRLFQTANMALAYVFTDIFKQEALEYAKSEVGRAYETWPELMPNNPIIRYMKIELKEIV